MLTFDKMENALGNKSDQSRKLIKNLKKELEDDTTIRDLVCFKLNLKNLQLSLAIGLISQ